MMNGSIDHLFWNLRDLICERRLVEAMVLWQEIQGHPRIADVISDLRDNLGKDCPEAKSLTDSELFWSNADGYSKFMSSWFIPF